MSLLRLTSSLLFAAALPAAALPEPRLVLEENFDDPELDPKIWNIETGKRRDAVNSPKSVDLRDGRLIITTWTDTDGTTYCGFVTTRNKFTVVAGMAEARLRFAAEPGTQICFWAQSPTYGRSGKAAGAAEDGVEIDIMESTGLMGGAYQYALHWGPYRLPEEKRTVSRRFRDKVGPEWHVYGVAWDDAGYRFSRDGKVVAVDTRCPGSRAPQFFLLTSESSLQNWSGERPAAGYGAKDKSRNLFEADWLKVWEQKPAAK
jgi:hypothetical protein